MVKFIVLLASLILYKMLERKMLKNNFYVIYYKISNDKSPIEYHGLPNKANITPSLFVCTFCNEFCS